MRSLLIKLNIARGIETRTTFQQAVEIAQRIKCIRVQGREAVKNKRPRHSGGFGGSSFGGKGLFGIGYFVRPVHSELQTFHGTLVTFSW